ncbi:helix-turn-helix domain-containing protein [Rahnella sp. ChDrAdgB13]|uniref:helix-turn-helix domain-containing protein n=1 Tax=Rahnella sp. ChDrAdgB13 TaxID=1850581 RepID=UPI001AD893CD|nr:helix-turn-helix domain-containing protein [Rahnella sp. ChDrAdgB13]
MKNPNRLTRKEAADYLGLSEQTLANWASTGRVKIPHYKIGGHRVTYLMSDLDAFVESGRRVQTL